MRKKIIISIMALMMLSISFSQVLSTEISNEKNIFYNLETNIIHVDKNNTAGPWTGSMQHPYQTISEAVNNAENDDIIDVSKGIYQEQITIDKSLWLIGEDKDKTIIDAQYNEFAINVLSDKTKIEKFTFINSGGYKENSAIKINGDYNKISDCIIKMTRVGILFNNTSNSMLENCSLYLNGKGVFLKSSNNIQIIDSEFCHSSIGVSSKKSNNIEIKKCYIHETGTGLFFNKSSDVKIVDCAICDNNDNGGGCVMYKSNDFDFINCNILHNGFGVLLRDSTNLNLGYCNIENITHYGVWAHKNVGEIKINKCNLVNNFRHAISMSSGNIQVKKSNLYNNQIDSVNIRNSFCDARFNWWGSALGPLFNYGFRPTNAIKRSFGKLKRLPWSLNPYKQAGADWVVKDIFSKTNVSGYEDNPIELNGIDTDNDGLPDWWEEKYDEFNSSVWNDHINIDNDEDGLNNFEECYAYNWGADPNKKDIFLEFDWTRSKTEAASNIIPEKYIEEIQERFEEHNISLHIDNGELDGGEEIPYITDFDFDMLTNLYWDYFLHNDLNNPRKNIFHYGLICDRGPGSGFAFMGWGHLNGFCISADVLSKGNPDISRGRLIATGSMHELGHTLGLFVDDFKGIDNHATVKPGYKEFWIYRNYKSCMSYQYTYFILDYSDGDNGRVDFDDWNNLEYTFFKNTHFEWPKD